MSIHNPTSLRQSAFVRYAVSFLTVSGAVLITAALRLITPHVPADLIYCATILSAWFGGVGPGLLAALISSLAIGFNLITPPYPDSSISSGRPRLAIISTGVLFVSWISGRQRRTEELLERARDELEETVQERTAELRRTNEELQAEIAERKVAEEALHTMQAELAHVSRVTMMGGLNAYIAHEVNQPFGAIMNYRNACRRLLAAGTENTTDIDQALSKIVEAAHRASDVISRIRALSQKKQPEKIFSAIKELIDDVLAVAKYEMLARGVTVRVDLDPDLPWLQVDRVQIQQVLLNLIINGMEAMEAMTPKNRIIELSARSCRHENEPALALLIRDYGTGVMPADESRLFEPFYSTKPEGMGMGLAISRSIVEAHGGRLSLLPSKETGATFQILLPVNEGANP